MSGLISIPSAISQLGIRQEATFKVGGTATMRGLLVTDFQSNLEGSFSPIKKISGIKGQHSLGRSGEHWAISFSVCASGSGLNGAGLGDILAMIYDKDVVTGASPFTHTFDVQSLANGIVKKSWALQHDDKDGETYEYRGFVAETAEIVIDKDAEIITVSVTGFAADRVDSAIAVAFDDLSVWSPVNAAIKFGAEQLDMFRVITITHEMGTTPNQTINNSAAPSLINGVTNDSRISVQGFFTSIGTTSGITLRDFFLNHSEQNTALTVVVGPNGTNDQLTLSYPLWAISEETSKALATDETLPQTMTFESIHKGVSANNHSSVLLSTVPTAFELI